MSDKCYAPIRVLEPGVWYEAWTNPFLGEQRKWVNSDKLIMLSPGVRVFTGWVTPLKLGKLIIGDTSTYSGFDTENLSIREMCNQQEAERLERVWETREGGPGYG